MRKKKKGRTKARKKGDCFWDRWCFENQEKVANSDLSIRLHILQVLVHRMQACTLPFKFWTKCTLFCSLPPEPFVCPAQLFVCSGEAFLCSRWGSAGSGRQVAHAFAPFVRKPGLWSAANMVPGGKSRQMDGRPIWKTGRISSTHCPAKWSDIPMIFYIWTLSFGRFKVNKNIVSCLWQKSDNLSKHFKAVSLNEWLDLD